MRTKKRFNPSWNVDIVDKIDNKNNLIVSYKYHAYLCIDHQVRITSDIKLRKKANRYFRCAITLLLFLGINKPLS
jgi:hypothetical protein